MLLYIHIPFCDSKCSYCAFNSYVDKFHLKASYMDALYKQLLFELEHFVAQKNSIETLFIGGGTPSTVSPELYAPIFKLLEPYLQKDAEITSEANPNSATYEWLEGMRELGVNRISFGVQSFDEKKLKLLNRAHTPQMAIDALNNAAKIGYKNLSLDLIYATAGDTKELLENDLTQAFTLPINHLSAYALTIEEGTAFERKPQMSQEKLELTEWLFETIKSHGFKQYEISNFGTYRSRHNLGYWEYKDYIGAGAGAVGKLQNRRFYPNPDIESYIEDPLKIRMEELSESDMRIEKIFLGLRSCVGVQKTFLTSDEQLRATLLAEENKLDFRDGVFYNPDYLLADEIALYISE
ncbi:MAG: radical SAM family heme chaperone HemW [Sulfurimonas sp.]